MCPFTRLPEKKTMHKKFYTTGEVARIIGISERTAKNYCTLGKIASEKTPITNYRRISYENLAKFLTENDLPTDLIANYKKSKTKILIVDDDPAIVEMFYELLKEISPDVIIETAGDGYDACVKAGILLPDIILLDLKMPKADGFEVCQSIRNQEATRRAKIIIITAYASEENKHRLQTFHPLAIFEKPLELETIAKKLKLLIGGKEKH